MEKNITVARRRLRERAEEMRYSLRELSLLIERNATYLTQYVNKGSPRELTERDRQRLGFLLKMAPQDLSDAVASEPGAASSARPEPPRPSASPASAGRLPVLSVALVGAGIGRVPMDQAVEMVERPPELEGVRDAFAVRVPSNAFYPAFRPGDVTLVHPNIPPLAGDLVCVTTAEGRLTLGRLVGDAVPDAPRVLSFTDFKETDLPGATVEKVVGVRYR